MTSAGSNAWRLLLGRWAINLLPSPHEKVSSLTRSVLGNSTMFLTRASDPRGASIPNIAFVEGDPVTFKKFTNLFLVANVPMMLCRTAGGLWWKRSHAREDEQGIGPCHVATPCHLVIVNANPTHSVVVVVYRSRTTDLPGYRTPFSGRIVF